MSTQAVAEFICDTRFDRLPSTVIEQAKRCTLDTLGSAIAGRNRRTVGIMDRLLRSLGEGNGEATVIGGARKASSPNATLLNSLISTVLDSDDGSMSSVGHLGHIGGCVIPAALAISEREGAGGRAFLEAVVAGYEVFLRTGWILTEPELKKFSISGTPGTYATAAAAAKLLKLAVPETIHALGIAEPHAPVPRMGRIALTGPMTKEAMPWGSMTGVTAALLAQLGFTGPRTLYDDPNPQNDCLEHLGRSYEILKVYFKPYCACRYTHAALDVILELMRSGEFAPQNVERITVEAGAGAALLSAIRPNTIEHAQYSFPYVIGAALAYGEVGPQQMEDSRLQDERILTFAEKVKIGYSEKINSLLPGRFAASVIVLTRDGKELRATREIPKGNPEDPMTEAELEAKFRKWTEPVIGRERAVRIVQTVRHLEELGRIDALIGLIASF